MSEQNDRYKNKIGNDLKSNDPDFDLDNYIDEQAGGDEAPGVSYRVKKKSTRKRDSVVIGVAAILVFLWYFNWNPLNAFGSSEASNIEFFGSSDQVTATQDQNLPSRLEATSSSSSSSASSSSSYPYIDFVKGVGELDFSSTPSASGIQAMYNNGVTLEYLQGLENLDILDDINYSGVIGLYANGVTLEYLNMLENLDYLDDLNYSSIIGLYANGVSTDYLQKLEDLDILDDTNYSGDRKSVV